jgi:uncharacterized protein YjbJ (UPF0337 family)
MTTRTICGPSCKCSKHTDTPRTDAAKSYWDGTERENCVSIAFARGLERELDEAKGEVERLKGQLQQAVDIAEWYMDNLVQSPRKDKLEAIKATLNQTNK